MFSFKLSATMRIAIGLAFMSATVLLAAMLCGIVPNSLQASMLARKQVCETIAVSMSLHVQDFEFERMKILLSSVVEHNDDILSASVREKEGHRVVEVGDHSAHWKEGEDAPGLNEQVVMPIVTGRDQPWGQVEIRFRPLRVRSVAGFLQDPTVRLFLFAPSVGLLIFYFYLRLMLQHLDPSKAVPQHVRSALDTLTEGLLVIDKRGRIAFANQVFANWIGKRSDQLMGKQVARLPWIVPPGEEELPQQEYPWDVAMHLKAPQVGMLMKLPMGASEQRALVVNASPVLGHEGDYGGVLTTFEDITELESNRVELNKAKEAAEHANREKSDFLARMSHEIRTPMNAILGYADVLRRGMDQSLNERQLYVDTIHTSGEHLLALINDILDLSKIESGKMDLELTPCSPHRLLNQVVSVLQVKAKEKAISLDFVWDGPAPETIITDQVRFRQCVMNLVGNAIKFTTEGGVSIVARLQQESKSPQLVVDVIDTGVGISTDAMERVFQPFSQADTTVTRRFGGTGLGLAISRQLAHAMGGNVTATSEAGKGSTFTMTVAIGSLKNVAIREAGFPEQDHSDDGRQEASLPPCRVLVVDDNEVNLNLVNLILSRAGAQVQTAENGQVAIDLVTSSDFDIVLMDMQMPVLDGYAATTKLRELGMTMPIVALTAHAMQGDEAKCRAAGCSGFLTKPLVIDRVLETIQRLVFPDAEEADVESNPPLPTQALTQEQAQVSPPGCDDAVVAEMQSTLREIAEIRTEIIASGQDLSAAETAGPSPGEEVESEAEGRIESQFPMDDPDFRAIVKLFLKRLDDQLDEMTRLLERADYAQLRELAHALKGSGGSAGFPAFTEPAGLLERLAVIGEDPDGMEESIDQLKRIRQRIKSPSDCVT